MKTKEIIQGIVIYLLIIAILLGIIAIVILDNPFTATPIFTNPIGRAFLVLITLVYILIYAEIISDKGRTETSSIIDRRLLNTHIEEINTIVNKKDYYEITFYKEKVVIQAKERSYDY